MALDARIIAERVRGDRGLIIIPTEKRCQIVGTLLQPLAPSKNSRAAVTINTRRLLLTMKRRQSARAFLDGLLIKSDFGFRVTRRAERVLILERERNAQSANRQNTADDEKQQPEEQVTHCSEQ